jgi:hypothetical protein
MKDFYYILGVDENCTLLEIKEAYRKLSKKFHPDLNQGDYYFDNRFREINEAYETLSDAGKRKQYNAALKKVKTGQQASSQGAYNSPRYQYKARPSGFYVSKIKGPGVGMSITLITIALILGVYIVQSVSNKKSTIVYNRPDTVASVPVKTVHHHKRKHSVKNKIHSNPAPIKPDSITRYPSAVAASIKKPTTANSIISKPPVINANHNPDFIYATYVNPNATGVVNMRKFDNYNSEVLTEIPANAKVFVLAKGSVYYKVRFNDNEGYVPKWALQAK